MLHLWAMWRHVIMLMILVVLGSCGADSTLIVVSVTGLSPNDRTIQATVKWNGKVVMPDSNITISLTDFGLELPVGANGPFYLLLKGMDAGGNVVDIGCTDTTLMGANRVRVTVPMQPTASATCTVP